MSSPSKQPPRQQRKRPSPDSSALGDDSRDDNYSHDSNHPLVPAGVLPSYLAQVFGELYRHDGLVVLGRGLQAQMLVAALVRFYGDVEEGHVAVQLEEQQEEEQQRQRKKNKKQQREASLTTFAAAAAPPVVAPPAKPERPPLVLVLGLTRETERSTLLDILTSWGTPAELLPTILTNESGQSKERTNLYLRGGVFVVTSRILIVDLLTGVVPSHAIQGVICANAHTVTETSTEAFILRIIQSQRMQQPRQQQQQQQQVDATTSSSSLQQFPDSTNYNISHRAFVKAVTDAPEQLLSSFAKVDKILKALHVQKLYLYPRFHDTIRDELEGTNPPHVTELHQDLTRTQSEMQHAIAAAVQACIRELKTATSNLLEWSSDAEQQLRVESIVGGTSSNFDQSISRQLEHDWHRLTPATKQLVQDLRTLRTLFQSLLLYDCVTFYKLLHSLQTMSAASRYPSMWLLTPAADVLFKTAKARVYSIVQQHAPPALDGTARSVAQCQTVLEENPKWRLLKQVLVEIQTEYEQQQQQQQQHSASSEPTHVLVMVKDDRTLDTLRDYLAQGGRRILWLRWLRYLEQYNDRSRSITDSKGGTAAISEESRLLLEEESRARRLLFGKHNNNKKRVTGQHNSEPLSSGTTKQHQQASSSLNHVPDYVRKRRRIAVERGRGRHQSDDLERQAVLDEAVETTEHEMAATLDPNKKRSASIHNNNSAQGTTEASLDPKDDRFAVSFPNELRVIIKSYASIEGDQATLLLQDYNPTHVVLYDSDVAFVRSVEIYSALSALPTPIRVFFLMFAASAEEKTFLKSLEREQNAFERLIQHKKTMPLPVLYTSSTTTQEMQHAMTHGSSVAGTYMDGDLPLSVDTRTGRGKKGTSATKDRRDIAVDVREFRSALPSILHQGGMRLAPVTLTVGDFVLSKVHCVERKSISDLFGSFASGRLFTQVEAMVKHYKVPCLLIEFDPAKAFSLQNANELGVEIRTDSICSKMVLLTMHFPQLRILWSRSPHETLRIFRELKKNHDEVDVDEAVEIGRNESEELLLHPEGKDAEEDEINEAARDMLLRLPGVNVHIARKIMQNCDSLAELCEMSRDELRKIAGPLTGQKLFTFFRQKLTAAGI